MLTSLAFTSHECSKNQICQLNVCRNSKFRVNTEALAKNEFIIQKDQILMMEIKLEVL